MANLESYLDSLTRGVDGKRPPSPHLPSPPQPAAATTIPMDTFFKRRSKAQSLRSSAAAASSSDEDATVKSKRSNSILSNFLPPSNKRESRNNLLPKFSFFHHPSPPQQPTKSMPSMRTASPQPIPSSATTPPLSQPSPLLQHSTTPRPLLSNMNNDASDLSLTDEKYSGESANDLLPPASSIEDPTSSTTARRMTRRTSANSRARSRGSAGGGDDLFADAGGMGTPKQASSLPEALKRIRDMDTALESNLLATDQGALLLVKSNVKRSGDNSQQQLAVSKLQLYNDKRLSRMAQKLERMEQDIDALHNLAGQIQDEIKLECTKLCDSVNKLTTTLQSDSDALKQRELFFRTTTQKIEREIKMIPEKVSDAVESKDRANDLLMNDMETRIRAALTFTGDSHGLLDTAMHKMQEFFLLGGGTLLKLVASIVVFLHAWLCFCRGTATRKPRV